MSTVGQRSSTFQIRPYEDFDREHIKALCPNLWDGRDWVPRLLDQCASQERNLPLVICCTSDNVPLSFVNVRQLSSFYRQNHDSSKARTEISRFYVEGVRVSNERRGQGIGTITVMNALRYVRSQERKKGLCTTMFWSVTEPDNAGMCSIFKQTGWKPITGFMHMWPSIQDVVAMRSGVTDDKRHKSFFELHDIPSPTPYLVSNYVETWKVLVKKADISSALESLRQRGGSGFRPDYFSAEIFTDAIEFLESDVAQEERRVIWGLDRYIEGWGESETVSLIFYRQKIVDNFPHAPPNVLSVCATDQLAAEESVRFIAFDIGLNDFQLAFDSSTTADVFQFSPILRCANADPFNLYENQEL